MISEKAEALQPAPQRQLCPLPSVVGLPTGQEVLGTHLARMSFHTGFSQLCPGAAEGLHLITHLEEAMVNSEQLLEPLRG